MWKSKGKTNLDTSEIVSLFIQVTLIDWGILGFIPIIVSSKNINPPPVI